MYNYSAGNVVIGTEYKLQCGGVQHRYYYVHSYKGSKIDILGSPGAELVRLVWNAWDMLFWWSKYPLLCFFSDCWYTHGTPNATKSLLNYCHISQLESTIMQFCYKKAVARPLQCSFFYSTRLFTFPSYLVQTTQATVHCSSYTMGNSLLTSLCQSWQSLYPCLHPQDAAFGLYPTGTCYY